MYERPGYRTIFGRLRENVRVYIRKQIELPKQEIAEIIRANLRAAMWFGIALACLLGTRVSLAVLVIALIALALPLWASALVVFVLFLVLAAASAYVGYRKLELHGPERTIRTMKEGVRWAKARLLGRSAS